MNRDELLSSIHFERQSGSLCAQHALNALLQAEYFNAIDLASIARDIDTKERAALIESGATDEDLAAFVKDGSNHYDDSGFFSSATIEGALEVWGLQLVPFESPDAADARENPVNEKAYICWLEQHWFTLRRFGLASSGAHRWYDLNSMHDKPKLVSDTYLGMLLAQLKHDGYTIFVVRGDFPQCEADLRVAMLPPPSSSDYANATPPKPSAFYGTGRTLGGSSGGGAPASTEDIARRAAEMLSGFGTTLGGAKAGGSMAVSAGFEDDEDALLAAAIAESLKDSSAGGSTEPKTAGAGAVSASEPAPVRAPPAAPARARMDSMMEDDDFFEDFDEDEGDEVDGEEGDEGDQDDEETSASLQMAVAASLGGKDCDAKKSETRGKKEEEEEMQRALQASLEEEKRKHSGAVDDAQEMRRKRLARFGGDCSKADGDSTGSG